MPTPHIIESTNTNVGQPIPQNWGPVFSGSSIFCVCDDFTQGSGTSKLGVFESTDGGVTWSSPLDSSNAPTYQFAFCYYSGSGNTLRFAYSPHANGNLSIVTFDISTRLWGTPNTGGPSVHIDATGGVNTSGQWQPLIMTCLSSGDSVIEYQEEPASTTSIHVVQVTAGVWGTPSLVQSVSSANGMRILNHALDASDRVHMMRVLSVSSNTVIYENIWDAGVLGADRNVFQHAGNQPQGLVFGPGRYLSGTDTILFPTLAFVGGFSPSGDVFTAFRGTPSNAPVYAGETINADHFDSEFLGWPRLAFGSESDIFYCWGNTISGPTGQLYYSRQQDGVTWQPEVVIWDEATDPLTPPSPVPAETSIFGVTAKMSGSTTLGLGLLSGFFQNVTSGAICAVQYYLEKDFVAAISIACPVDGGTAQVGVPYDAFLVVTGGTPPYTFSIASGSLPPGLTLDTSTGEISGTPTLAGTYDYTAQVMDSSSPALTATTSPGCEIVVSPSPLAAACPINGGTAQVGVPYSAQLIASGGTPPYTWRQIS